MSFSEATAQSLAGRVHLAFIRIAVMVTAALYSTPARRR